MTQKLKKYTAVYILYSKMDDKNITTIKLSKETKQRLEKLREHRRESYDELLRKVLWILNTVKLDSEKAKKVLSKIDDNRKRLLKKLEIKKN